MNTKRILRRARKRKDPMSATPRIGHVSRIIPENFYDPLVTVEEAAIIREEIVSGLAVKDYLNWSPTTIIMKPPPTRAELAELIQRSCETVMRNNGRYYPEIDREGRIVYIDSQATARNSD